MLELKRLSISAIPGALAKAERYRLLNEPEQARSICEDILAADPGNRAATATLILSLTDVFAHYERGAVTRAQQLVATLPSDYERLYYGGLVAERRARALLRRAGPGRARPAGDLLREAMRSFERAESLKPADNDDALLRWNACARMFDAHAELTVTDDEPTTPVMLE